MSFYRKHIRKNRFYRGLLLLLRNWKIGDGRASLYDVLYILWYELKLDSITKRSGYMAFNFTLAIFPGIIFLFTLIPYTRIPNLEESIMTMLQELMPANMYSTSAETIQDIISKPRGGLLSFGFGFALFLSTNAIMGMMDVFNKQTHTFEHRSYIKKRLIAAALTVALALIVFLAIAAIFMGTYFIDILVFHGILPESFYYLVVVLKHAAVIMLFFTASSLVYHYAPATTNKWGFFSAGSIVATILIFLVSLVFSAYINNFDSYNKFYGSIGVLIGLMIWLDFISMVLLLGFEINVSIDAVNQKQAYPDLQHSAI